MNAQDTANLYLEWPAGMAVTLSLYKRQQTPSNATRDPFAAPIVLSACRKRNLTYKMTLAYGPVIELERARLFEVWPGADGQPLNIVAGNDVLQEDNGATPSAWSSLTTYSPGNLVTQAGNYYLCIQASTNNQPPNATYWTLAPRWTVKFKPQTIFDNATLALCIPE